MGRTQKVTPRLSGYGNFVRWSLLVIDLLMLLIAFGLGYLVRRQLPLFSSGFQASFDPPELSFYAPILIIQTATLLTIFFFARLYHQRRAASRIDTGYTIAAGVSIGVVMTNGISSILFKGTGVGVDYPRQMILYVWIFSIIAVILGREVHRQITVLMRKWGVARDRVLIVGSGDIARTIIQHIQHSPQLGYSIVGAVRGPAATLAPSPAPIGIMYMPAFEAEAVPYPGTEQNEIEGIPYLGGPEMLSELIDSLRVDEVILALPDTPRPDLVQLISTCQRGRVSIKIYPDLFAYITGGMSVDDLGGMPLINVRDVALRGWKLSLKRALDVFGSVFGLIFLSPLFLLTAVLIRMESAGPIFFSQERMGLDGRSFPMIKFRSMRQDAEKHGPGWTVQGDPRVTRIGKWMRKTNWDEIPNLINVLWGHMSLVGPRPEQTHFVEQFRAKIPRYMERHREKAGMTGWAQVNGLRGDTSIEERIKYDLWYVENWSIWLDIKIILRTVIQTVLRRSPNAY